MELISITGYSSFSPLGDDKETVWNNYLKSCHFLIETKQDNVLAIVGSLSSELEQRIKLLKHENAKYKNLDKTVLMAIEVSRKAVKQACWQSSDFGINIGSSRGATALFEAFYDDFSNNNLGKTHPLTSPTTTLGNLSTWVADDLQSDGPTISHSITCSTGLHAVLNGVAWINSGMSDKFLVGATEAPNTAFTIAQMQAIKIYVDNDKDEYPCKALDFSKNKNTMCLGEGAAVFCLEKGKQDNAIAYIEAVGYATEKLKHNISITEDADCFQKSMKMAIKELDDEIDVIVMHAPGTLKGDSSEYNAIKKVFGEDFPAITSNKWKIGHTLGASGSLSMELALLMLEKQEFIGIPYLENLQVPKKIERIMVNAVGFGGNAVSIVLKRN